MAIQNDNTLVTKGDLKSLYTDKIAPYLGGGISYYYTDRSGQELKSADLKLSASQSITSLAENVLVNFTANSGTLTVANNKVIIPEGMRVQFGLVVQHMPQGTNTPNVSYRIYDYKNDVEIGVTYSPYLSGGYARSSALSAQYTAPTGGAEIGIKARNHSSNATTIDPDATRFTVQEIGRIVDPVKYVSNNSDLQETPVGNIISYMGNSVPKHYLACDGHEYPIGSYPELEAHFISEFGSVNYFGGDGTSTFAVPDLRGEFLRGTGENSRTNQGIGANVGIHQDGTEVPNTFAYGSKWHGIYTLGTATDTFNAYPIKMDSTISGDGYIQNASAESIVSQSTATKSYTTRPTNTSVKYCIKYESTFHAFFSNAAYKVSVAASVAASSAVQLIFDSSDIIGDSSLISGNSLVAPMDGWYSLGMNWSQSGSGDIGYYIRINGASGKGYNRGIFISDTLYLNKGDVITIWKESGSANSGRVNFCLLTSNYNPTIVNASDVYSENEQMIGYWTDGKPIYQKTINFGVLPNKTGKTVNHNISNLERVVNAIGTAMNGNGGYRTIPVLYNATYASYNTAFLVDATKILIETDNDMSSFTNAYITIQYTKTTDTASTLQIDNSLLLNRPDLWEVGTEYHFGGGLYGIRKTGTITAASDERVWTAIVTTSSGNLPSIIDSGGWIKWGDEGTHDYKYSINSTLTGLAGWGNTLGAWSVMRTGDTQIALWNTSGLPRTNAPYDVWVTYKK